MQFLSSPSTLSMLENACLIVTFAMFSSGIPDVKQMLSARATGNVQFLPFLMCCINCSAWLIYGRLKDNQTIFFVNLVGALSQAFYMVIYILYSTMQRALMKLTILSFFIFYLVYYMTMASFTVDEALNIFGSICCIITCLMFASPLTEIKTVIYNKSTATISYPLTITSFLCGASWTLYGLAMNDYYVIIPNLMGLSTSLVRIYLFRKYPNTSINDKIYDSVPM